MSVDIQNINVPRRWRETPRDARETRWESLYATLNAEGDLVISRRTHEVLGSPDSYLLLFDVERNVIGLRPANAAVEKNAYPARRRGRYGGRRIRALRMMREFGVQIYETVRFHRCQLDNSGILILDLRDTRPAGKRRR